VSDAELPVGDGFGVPSLRLKLAGLGESNYSSGEKGWEARSANLGKGLRSQGGKRGEC
jgi:hypothetical protein